MELFGNRSGVSTSADAVVFLAAAAEVFVVSLLLGVVADVELFVSFLG